MRIVRAPHRAGYTQIANDTLEDRRLSFKARGLLAYLISRPPGWETDSERLADVGPDGRDAIRTGMRELVAAGYMTREKRQGERGRWSTFVAVHERPQGVDNAPPTTGYPTPEKPTVGQSGATTKTETNTPPYPRKRGSDPPACRHRRPRAGCATCPEPEPKHPPRPAWCGSCVEGTRLTHVGSPDGPLKVGRCPTCHPLANAEPPF